MAMNRPLYKASFGKDDLPKWQCPSCGVGLLVLRKDTFQVFESKESQDAHASEDWEPEWTTYSNAAILDCSNQDCKEVVFSCGRGSVEQEWFFDGDREDYGYVDSFTPEFFFPPLSIFSIPISCPNTVADEIKLSFKLFFCDPASAANHVRQAVENMMTEEKVPRFQLDRHKKRIYVPLHSRIVGFSNRNAKTKAFGEKLMALKWLGNAGSHSSNITKD